MHTFIPHKNNHLIKKLIVEEKKAYKSYCQFNRNVFFNKINTEHIN